MLLDKTMTVNVCYITIVVIIIRHQLYLSIFLRNETPLKNEIGQQQGLGQFRADFFDGLFTFDKQLTTVTHIVPFFKDKL